MPFCVNCGSELRPRARFCTRCGARARIPSKLKTKPVIPEKKVSKQTRTSLDTIESGLTDLAEIEEKIREYETILAEEPAIDRQIQKLNHDLAEIEKEIRRIVRIRAREELDVRELEGLSWKSIKAMFRGELQQLKEKEQREFLTALAKEKEVKQERLNIIRQLDKLREEKRKIQRIKHELPKLKSLLETHQTQVRRTSTETPEIIEQRQAHHALKLERSLKQQEQEHLENVIQSLNVADRYFTNILRHIDEAEPAYQERRSVEQVAELFSKEPLTTARREILHAQQALRQASMELLAISENKTSKISIPDFKYQEIIDLMIDEALAGKGFTQTKQRLQTIQRNIKDALAMLSPTQEQVEEEITRIEAKELQYGQKNDQITPNLVSTENKTMSTSSLESDKPTSMRTTSEEDESIIQQQASPVSPPSNELQVLERLYQYLDEISYRFNNLSRKEEEIITKFSTGAIEVARWTITSNGDLRITFTGKNINKNFDIVMEKPTDDNLPPYDWLNPFAGIHIITSEEVLYRLKQETQLAENIRKIKQPLRIEVKTTPNISGQLTVKNFNLEDVEDVVQVVKDLGWSLELSL